MIHPPEPYRERAKSKKTRRAKNRIQTTMEEVRQ